MNRVVEMQFPKIAARMRQCVQVIEEEHHIKCDFGLFWNLCINAPLFDKGINNVVCDAHCDSKNGGVLVCAVLVYYFGEGA